MLGAFCPFYFRFNRDGKGMEDWVLKEEGKVKVGIGFATGRKHFKKLLKSYIFSWKESGLVEDANLLLHIFVAYDLSYHKTKIKDYTDIRPEVIGNIDGTTFLGKNEINQEMAYLISEGIIDANEVQKIFGKGYASQRNTLLYSAIKHDMDYLIFLDDDEYPMAVTNAKKHAVWSGQHVLATHIKNIKDADLTHGHHCGYISPIPFIEYNDIMSEADFRSFIETISNDILNWDNVKAVMNNGGVTYAKTDILTTEMPVEVQEVQHAKFISGANLGINLSNPTCVFPFYNPAGARGEDTFLSTCLRDRRVLRIPVYTFHDGFSTYKHLLEGVLPIQLKYIKGDNEKIVNRFYKACLGWIRYKPLLMYITDADNYDKKIEEMSLQLNVVLPKIAAFFNKPDFINIQTELKKYDKNVRKHYQEFLETQLIWGKIMDHFSKQ